jgi:hypothetical protein
MATPGYTTSARSGADMEGQPQPALDILPQMSLVDRSKEFGDICFLALDHAFESVASGGGPLTPFTVVAEPGSERRLTRFVSERLELGVENAKSSIGPGQPATMYAIAWDGYVTVEGRRWDAVFVEAGETSQQAAILLCQRYTQTKAGLFRKARCERVGNPMLVANPPSRLWPSS